MKPEVAADLSGGGFSNYFMRPFYQDAAVSTYLKSVGTTYSGLYKCVFFFSFDMGDPTGLTCT